MRILLIHSFYKPGLPSGENNVVLSQAELLERNGFEVLVWGPTSPDAMGFKQRIRTAGNVIRGTGADPTQAILKFNPDLIHVHNIFPNISTKWMSKVSVPIVMSIHNYRTVCANGTFIRDSKLCTDCLQHSSLSALKHGCYMSSRAATLPVLGLQQYLRSAIDHEVATLIYTSEYSRDLMAGVLHPKSSVVIPNFVADTRNSRKSELPLEDGYFVVAGRLSPEKGLGGLLRIWPSRTRLIVLGDGPQRGELEEASDSSWVDFKGFVDADTRNSLLAGARALILPSVTPEADPVIVAQALSAGTPVIALAQTATAKLATETGAVQEYSDEDSLVRAMANLNESRRAAARQIYLERWSETAWLTAYTMLLPPA